jgi:hypothetical protein
MRYIMTVLFFLVAMLGLYGVGDVLLHHPSLQHAITVVIAAILLCAIGITGGLLFWSIK